MWKKGSCTEATCTNIDSMYDVLFSITLSWLHCICSVKFLVMLKRLNDAIILQYLYFDIWIIFPLLCDNSLRERTDLALCIYLNLFASIWAPIRWWSQITPLYDSTYSSCFPQRSQKWLVNIDETHLKQ